MKRILAVAICATVQVACSSGKILRDQDYENSVTLFKQSEFESARAAFPSEREEGGFITSIEKSWIDLWRERYNSTELLKHTDTFEARKFIRLSREAGTFLLAESEEGYIPSEAEVAMLGVGLGAAIWGVASDMQKGFDHKVKKGHERRLRELRTYRMVRFMPEFISLKRVDFQCENCKRIELPRIGPTQVTLVLQP